jgi:hypothetical protein
LGVSDPTVLPHALYRALGGSQEARLAAYRGLFEVVLDAELLRRLRACTNGGFVLGSPTFERQIAAMLGRRTWRGAPGRPRKDTEPGEQRELVLQQAEKRGLSRVFAAAAGSPASDAPGAGDLRSMSCAIAPKTRMPSRRNQ